MLEVNNLVFAFNILDTGRLGEEHIFPEALRDSQAVFSQPCLVGRFRCNYPIALRCM